LVTQMLRLRKHGDLATRKEDGKRQVKGERGGVMKSRERANYATGDEGRE